MQSIRPILISIVLLVKHFKLVKSGPPPNVQPVCVVRTARSYSSCGIISTVGSHTDDAAKTYGNTFFVWSHYIRLSVERIQSA